MNDIVDRAKAALEGVSRSPWTVAPDAEQPNDLDSESWCDVDGDLGGWVAHCQDIDTARFIAAARQLVPKLVAELETTRAELARLKASQEATA